jgi:hypothetical protein
MLLFAIFSIECKSIQTSNQILTQIGNRSITVLDIKKDMDRQIFVSDKSIFEDIEKTYTYYQQNWRKTLQKIVQDEALLLEAKKLKYELPSYEINKKVTELFGDKEVEAYKFLSITPEEAKATGERELISTHLSWFQIWNKTLQGATPSKVQKAYESYITELAKKDTWTYQALYVSCKEKEKVEEITSSISNLLNSGSFQNLASIMENITFDENQVKVQVSKEITLRTNEISSSILNVLNSLEEGMISKAILEKNNKNFTGKILQLKEHKKEFIPRFVDIGESLKNQIVTTEGEKISTEYFSKLFKQYDVDGLYGAKLSTSTLEPFVIIND